MRGKLPLILIAAALLGAVVWVLGPGTSPSEPPQTASAPPPREPRPPIRPAPREPNATKINRQPKANTPEGIDNMVAGQHMRAEQELARLVRMFNLSAAQEEQLRAWYQSQIASIEERLRAPGGMTPQLTEELAALLRGKGLEEALQGILTPEQLAQHNSKKEADRKAQVDRQVSKQMKKLEKNLNLSSSQVPALRKVIFDRSMIRYDERSSEMPYRTWVSNGRGVNLDPPISAVGGPVAGEEFVPDVDPILEPYKDILNPRQLETLREILEREGIQLVRSQKESDSLGVRHPPELPLIRGISSN